MRPSIRIAAAGFAFAVVSISCTWSASGAGTGQDIRNEVAHRDRETRVVVFYVYDTISLDAVSEFLPPAAHLGIDPPQNGTVRIDETDFTPKGCPNLDQGKTRRVLPAEPWLCPARTALPPEKGPQGRVDETAEGLHVFEVTVK